MAVMICGAIDWSLDIAWADADSVKALPLEHGVYSKNMSDERKFMQWLKTDARFFEERWLKEHDGCGYDKYDGWVGDAWLKHLTRECCLSDYYKDTYGQRPHFDYEFFAMMCGLPTRGETTIRWDRYDEHCREQAKANREMLMSM